MNVYIIKVTEDGLGRYNSEKISTKYVVAFSVDDAISEVFTSNTRCIEVVDVKPCFLCPKSGCKL